MPGSATNVHLKLDARLGVEAALPGSCDAAVDYVQRDLNTPLLNYQDDAHQWTSGASPRISFERLDRFDSFEYVRHSF